MSKILNFFREQHQNFFTGKVHFLNSQRQFLGHLSMLKGEPLAAYSNGDTGPKALKNLLNQQHKNGETQLIAEPENIDSEVLNLNMTYKQFYKYIDSYSELNDKVLIKKEFIITGENISKKEFDALLLISQYNTKKDINSNLLSKLECKNAIELIKG